VAAERFEDRLRRAVERPVTVALRDRDSAFVTVSTGTAGRIASLVAAVRKYAVQSSLGQRQVDARMAMFAALDALDEAAGRG
jgi:hypothetical protein